MIDYERELSDEQRAAVLYDEGPSLVVAGAGSGKTRVLTYKVAHLIECGVPASRIMALTFTNKAAREMQERVTRLVGATSLRGLSMGTFHSVFSRVMRPFAHFLGYTSQFTIYDTTDSRSLIKKIIKVHRIFCFTTRCVEGIYLVGARDHQKAVIIPIFLS